MACLVAGSLVVLLLQVYRLHRHGTYGATQEGLQIFEWITSIFRIQEVTKKLLRLLRSSSVFERCPKSSANADLFVDGKFLANIQVNNFL